MAESRAVPANQASATSEKPMLIEDDDDDDDIMLVEDETTVNSKSSITGQSIAEILGDVNAHINLVKQTVKESEEEISMMHKSLKSMESSLGEAIYEQLKFLMDDPTCLVTLPEGKDGLQAMITGVIEEVVTPDLVDMSSHEHQVLTKRLDEIENANHAVSKMFLECHGKLKAIGLSLAEDRAKINEETAYYERILAQRKAITTINLDEDDDDDVKIVDDPTPLSKSPAKSAQTDRKNEGHGLNITECRSRFASALQSQMPGLLNTLNSQQEHAASKVSSLSSSADKEKVPPSVLNDSTSVLAALMAEADNSPETPIVWPKLQVADKVLGKKGNDVWYPGVILDIYPPEPPEETEWRFKVRFGKGMKILPGKHVAYKDSIKCVVRVGTRVTALYKEEDAPNTMYAGIISEAPSVKNNKRFLVFFDDGYAQYCQASEVHKVYMQSENVWEDIHPETRSFIKDYLDIYPERPMVRLAKGQVVKTEWNGKWWTAKVIELDSSLVKMVFQADRRTEWIYRGSTRLEPLFRALTNANAIKAAGSSRGRRHNIRMKPSDIRRRQAVVEYTRGGSIEEDGSKDKEDSGRASTRSSSQANKDKEAADKKKSNVARKSTGGLTTQAYRNAPLVPDKWEAPWLKYQRKASATTTTTTTTATTTTQGTSSGTGLDSLSQEMISVEKTRSATRGQTKQAPPPDSSAKKSQDIASLLEERLAQSQENVEYDEHVETGKRRDITIDTMGKARSQFVPHTCSPRCLGNTEEILEDPQKMKGQSPMLIPLLCFWERQVCKARPNPRRFVVYRGPCGRRLRSLGEVDKYLQLTNSQLGIDYFSLDHNLHVSREFVPIKTFCDIKDLSYGIENYPISCVNGIDRHYPDYVEYYNYRIPAKGVSLNLNPEFLACCDCTDNCRDKSKCACAKLTIQNTSCIGEEDIEAGYHYRRLRDPLFTGIYECNSRCHCDKRCHNKVAQLGLRMRLQVFRTEKKGWGLRCLDDIAKGSFICIYAGQLLTDKGANEDGKQYGDEYLAELDFMEVVEGQKEGYESDVEFSDDDKDKQDSEDSDYSSSAAVTSVGVGERRRSSRRNTKDTEKEEAKHKDKPKPESKTTESQTTTVETPISISDEGDDEGDDEDSKGSTPKPIQDKEPPKAATPAPPTEVRRRAKKSTGGSRLNLSYSAINKSSEPEESDKTKQKKPERLPTRSYFRDETECYIMDAKSMGNLGRYLNHSCSPNVFVQNIFVDTHDLRFPWVAFFAGEYIRAGTELTWDYNYEVGSVPDKILYCYCGSSVCRGRLL